MGTAISRLASTLALIGVVVAAVAGCVPDGRPTVARRPSGKFPPGVSTPATEPIPAGFAAAVPPPAFAGYVTKLAAYAATLETSEPPRAWYPSRLPDGFSLASIETTELDPELHSGPVCDIVFKRGKAKIYFSQGSPVMRDYQVVSAGVVSWGSSAADLMRAESADGVDSIVFVEPGDLAELSGDVGIDQLEVIAANMAAVR